MKTTLKIGAAVLLAALAFTQYASAADGKELYTKDCAKCHGADGKGNTKMGQKLGARDYTDAKVQAEVSDANAVKAVKEGLKDKDGKTLMKPFDTYKDDDIKAVVAYVRSFKK